MDWELTSPIFHIRWKATYKYNEDNKVSFMTENLIGGMYQVSETKGFFEPIRVHRFDDRTQGFWSGAPQEAVGLESNVRGKRRLPYSSGLLGIH